MWGSADLFRPAGHGVVPAWLQEAGPLCLPAPCVDMKDLQHLEELQHGCQETPEWGPYESPPGGDLNQASIH